MLVGLVDEQIHLGAASRACLQKVADNAAVRRLMATPTGSDAASWNALGALGVLGLLVPEEFGGAGATMIDAGVVLEEMGRRLYPGPYLSSSILAVSTLLHAEDNGLLKEVADGSCIATVAVTETSADWSLSDIRTEAARSGGQWLLTGTKNWVPDGAVADVVLVFARAADGPRLFAVDGTADGLIRTALPTLDQTRKQARLEFARTPARPVALREPIEAVLRAVELAGMTAVAAEQVGGAQEVFDLVLEHVRSRTQFGKPIGSFQAVQHKCADMVVDIESARSAAYYAAAALAFNAEDAVEAAELAKCFCSDMYRRVTATAFQLFGGIAMTWEHPIHLYFKRARSSELLFGSPARHREKLADLLGM